MIGAILWGIACWYFGIPCSKSHSLIAGITGGAIAMNGWAGVVPAEWAKVIYGMVFSLVAGFVLGWLFTRLIEWIFKFVQRQAANKIFTIIQDIAAVALSFLHGAQDGQKFMSIAMLGIALSFGSSTPDSSGFPLWIMVICPASALDYATDAALRKALRTLPAETTLFIVSQRTSSLRHADQIIVLDDGHVVGIGTHDTLMQTCEVYREIHESQFRKGSDVQ